MCLTIFISAHSTPSFTFNSCRSYSVKFLFIKTQFSWIKERVLKSKVSYQNSIIFSQIQMFLCMCIYSKQTSSTFLLGMWKNDSNSFSLTCVWSSGKQSLIFLNTSALSWEQIEPPVHESFEVPSLLCSHNDVSLSLTFAILNRGIVFFR